MRLGLRPLRCCPWIGLVAHALLAVPTAAAQSKAAADFDALMPKHFAYSVPADALVKRAGGHARSAPEERDALPALRANRWISASLVEMPRDAIPGRYQRPRYALGFRSEALRNWLKEAGVDAQSCIAPVLRMRTKLSSDGDFSGALWLYARCSFN